MLSNAISAALVLLQQGGWRQCGKWVAGLFIAGYLTVLGMGLVCHTFKWNRSSHPLMYYIVWDMFCGWSSYESRYHVIGEGVSGTYYQVLPGPWGDFKPYGNLSRHHYDSEGNASGRLAMNVLRQTEHEEITRIFIVEQSWPKKYNMPDDQWTARWNGPKEPRHYYTLRHVITPQGLVLQTYDSFYRQQLSYEMSSNPALTAQLRSVQPVYVSTQRSPSSLFETSRTTGDQPAFGSLLGN